MNSKIRQEVTAFLRKSLGERLEQCTEAQRALFARVYPGGPKDKKLVEAIELCDRTVAKNIAKRGGGA